MQNTEDEVRLQFLQGAFHVQKLLNVAEKVRLSLPADSPFKTELLEALEPFESSVAVTCYNLDEMAEQAPGGDPISPEVAGRALELLVEDFPHPWDEFTGFVRQAQAQINAEAAAAEQKAGDAPSGG